jgi:uncharacterized membrane protein
MWLNRPSFNSSDRLPVLLVAAGETAVAALWLPLIARMSGPGVSTPSAAGLFIIGLFAYGWTRGTWGRRSIALTTVVALLLIVVWLLVTTGGHDAAHGWPVVVLGATAWGRGSLLAGKNDLATPERAHRLLGVGALLSAAALFVSFAWHAAVSEAVQRAAWWTIPTFLLSALLLAALGVAGAITPRDDSPARRQEASAGGFVATLLLVAVALVMLFGGGTDLPQRAVRAVIEFAAFIMFWLLVGLEYIVFYAIVGILRLFGIRLEFPPLPHHATPQPQKQKPEHHAFPLWFELTLILLVTLLLLGLLFWYLPRLRRLLRRRRSRSGVEIVRSSLHEPGSLLGNLRDLWPRRRPRHNGVLVDLRAPPTDVRDAYRKLLVIATRAGQPRAPSESPRDYAMRLSGIWTDLDLPITELTSRYIATRYGETSAADDLRHAGAAWERIRVALVENAQAGEDRRNTRV